MDTKQEVKEIMQILEQKGVPNTVSIYRKHGAMGKLFGVKVSDLKPLQKKYKGNNAIAKELYRTNNSDAMYLAALIANAKELGKEEIQKWVENAWWYMISEHAAAWMVSEGKDAFEHIKELMKSKEEHILSCAWASLSKYLSLTPDEELDKNYLKERLNDVVKNIHEQANRVKYTMNGFVIALGSYVPDLLDMSKDAAKEIGKVEVFMGETNCKVPLAADYISKVEKRGAIGKKRKTAKC